MRPHRNNRDTCAALVLDLECGFHREQIERIYNTLDSLPDQSVSVRIDSDVLDVRHLFYAYDHGHISRSSCLDGFESKLNWKFLFEQLSIQPANKIPLDPGMGGRQAKGGGFSIDT